MKAVVLLIHNQILLDVWQEFKHINLNELFICKDLSHFVSPFHCLCYVKVKNLTYDTWKINTNARYSLKNYLTRHLHYWPSHISQRDVQYLGTKSNHSKTKRVVLYICYAKGKWNRWKQKVKSNCIEIFKL